MSLEENLSSMERSREAYWRRYPNTSPSKLRWRALTVRHSFHVLPGESILELGAGSGLWTEHLSAVLRGENPITAAVFNHEFCQSPPDIPNVNFVRVTNFSEDLPAESFDYVVGTAGYDVREVPISWINRTIGMGSSSFKIVKVAPNYFFEFLRIVWNTWRGRRRFVRSSSDGAQERPTPEPLPSGPSGEK